VDMVEAPGVEPFRAIEDIELTDFCNCADVFHAAVHTYDGTVWHSGFGFIARIGDTPAMGRTGSWLDQELGGDAK